MQTQTIKTQKLEQMQISELPKTSELISPVQSHTQKTVADIQSWLVDYIANLLAIAPDTINLTTPFDHYGLDSFTAISLTGELEIWMGREVDPMLLYDYPTIQTLAQSLAETNNQCMEY